MLTNLELSVRDLVIKVLTKEDAYSSEPDSQPKLVPTLMLRMKGLCFKREG